MSAPSSYRLQLRNGFAFAEARAALPYLAELGVGAVYLSPVFAARAGSTHGYDVVDPSRTDPVLGDFRALAVAARDAGIGVVLDIVPNHMAASVENPWWADVLRRGRSSGYAGFFDVDWDRHGGKVLLPVLGEPYADAVGSGALRVRDGALDYHGLRLPLRPGTRRAGGVDAVVAQQHYIPSYWRAAATEGNYRRFFDINDLASMRTDAPAVFEATHRFVTGLVTDGLVTGLRVDHIDGLADPAGYLRRLREASGGAWLLVEKILARDEELPRDWSCDGTTGYEVANALDEMLVDPEGVQALTALLPEAVRDFSRVEHEARREVIAALFPSDVTRLVAELVAIAREHPLGRDLTAAELRAAVEETTAQMRVYRTYAAGGRSSRDDRARIAQALRDAGDVLGADAAPALRFLADVLRRGETSWQRLTGPVAAKGVEDTALYRYPRLVSLNEVGADPGATPGVGRLHDLFAGRAKRFGGGLNAASTHDTKRSADVRARIDVLSEMPRRWASTVRRWSARTRTYDVGYAMELLAFQTVVGAWPLRRRDERAFAGRLAAYLTKAAREAKQHTTWLAPDSSYERRLTAFARALVSDEQVRSDVASLLRVVGPAGASNALAGLTVRMTAPGVPDVYQGTETWRLDLVDPDNRRPVDFAALGVALRALPDDPAELLESWTDGRVKLFATTRMLHARRRHPALFARGSYEPLRVLGEHAEHAVAYVRRRGRSAVVVVVPRLTTRISRGRFPLGRDVWGDTGVVLPGVPTAPLVDVFTGRTVAATRRLAVGDILDEFPAFAGVSGRAATG